MFIVCCSSKCHMLKFPLMSLLWSPLLSLCFLTEFFLENVEDCAILSVVTIVIIQEPC